MRPSIMSEGASTSAPASACTSACLTSAALRLVVDDLVADQQAVVSVACVGIERDVENDAEVEPGVFDGARRAADQVVGLKASRASSERFSGSVNGKQCDRGDAEFGRILRASTMRSMLQPLDARH